MAQEMTRLLEAAKSDMMLGLKNRETSLLELKLGQYILLYLYPLFGFLYVIGFISVKRRKLWI